MNVYEKQSYSSRAESLLGSHQVIMKDRKLMEVTGVRRLHRFDDALFEIETTMGTLTVTGVDLEMKSLDLEKGELAIVGHIGTHEYDNDGFGGSKEGLFSKLFK